MIEIGGTFCFGEEIGDSMRRAGDIINGEWRYVTVDSLLSAACVAYYDKLPSNEEKREFRRFLSVKFILTDEEKRQLYDES